MGHHILEKHKGLWHTIRSKWMNGTVILPIELAFLELFEVIKYPHHIGSVQMFNRHVQLAERLFERNPNGRIEQAVVELTVAATSVLEEFHGNLESFVDI